MEVEAPDNFFLATAAKTVDRGLDAQIAAHMNAHPDTVLIVVDVLQRIRSSRTPGNRNAYENDSAELEQIKRIADKYKVALLLIHHNRKGRDLTNPFLNLSGSQGIMSVPDATIVIQKESRFDVQAKFSIAGREMEEREFIAAFDKKTFRWQYIGSKDDEEARQDKEAYRQDPVVITILRRMEEHPEGFSSTPRDFSSTMHAYAGCSIPENQVGQRFRKYAHMLIMYDRIVVSFGSTKKRVYNFQYATDMGKTPDTAEDADTTDTAATTDTQT